MWWGGLLRIDICSVLGRTRSALKKNNMAARAQRCNGVFVSIDVAFGSKNFSDQVRASDVRSSTPRNILRKRRMLDYYFAFVKDSHGQRPISDCNMSYSVVSYFGERSGNRTLDLLIKSQLLYRLS
jgi:hypothetical protein